MGKYIDIYSAINNLPDNLVTDQIWEAAMEEGNLKILNILPEKFMIEVNINKIIQKGEEKRSWYGFKLDKIPEIARTQKICDLAVDKDKENFWHVPDGKRSKAMLSNFLIFAENHINFLPLFPSELWDSEFAYSGIYSIYKNSSKSNDKWDGLKLIQVFLHYVPAEIKTADFFIGLFNTSMKADDINFLTPDKFKTDRFYMEMGKKEIAAVPFNKINYKLLCKAIKSEKNNESDFWGDWRKENSEIKQLMFDLMDSKMVDIILKRWPDKISKLPEKYQTKNRLLTALASCKDKDRGHQVYSSFDTTKFDVDICKAIVKLQEYDCPKFAPEIWTPDFVDFCMENARYYRWFSAMPQELQTQKIVDTVIKYSINKISDVRPDLISYDIAVEAYLVADKWNGKRELDNYVPVRYLNDFVLETGLPKEFFGGETSYDDLKEKRKNYTYFVAGDCYVGFYADKDSYNTYNRVIMTRKTPMQIKPGIVLNRTVSTFHKTWLEKIISDNDPQFAKPQVEKGMKGKQINLYMGVRHLETFNNVKIYAHSFLGETVLYSAGYMERNTLVKMKEAITELQQEQVEVAC